MLFGLVAKPAKAAAPDANFLDSWMVFAYTSFELDRERRRRGNPKRPATLVWLWRGKSSAPALSKLRR